MGREVREYLHVDVVWVCKHCSATLADHKDLESKAFQGRTGSAFLFRSVVNVIEGETKEKDFTTGRHIVTVVHCKFCNNKLGWKYIKAIPLDQKYKEGKTLLEKALMKKFRQNQNSSNDSDLS